MPRGLRIISIILFIIGLGFLLLMMIAQRFLTRSLPKTQGELLLSGLKYEVRVYRDGYHIPHIIAQNEHDLFFTQGFITAQDRLWQMDLWRRAAQGRLSEILGRSTIVHDSLMLTLGISRTVREMEAQLSVKSRQVLQAYSDGINACIKEQNDKWPIEFLLLNYRPEPWTIYDCLTILRWAAWHMSSNTSHNLIGSAINAKVGYEKASVFNLGNKQLTIKGQPEKSRNIIPALIKAETFIHANNSVFPSGKNQCWAISGERSVTGKPIIIVETLFPFSCPSLWYETHLVNNTWNVSGFSLPGFPMIYIGYNKNIAWAFSKTCEDNIRYSTDKMIQNKTLDEKISIRGLNTRSFPIHMGDSGPLIVKPDPQQKESPALVINWTGNKISDECMALYHLNQAVDWISFQQALKTFQVPRQYALYADRKGNIGMTVTGSQKTVNCPSDTRSEKWNGHNLHSLLNPKNGYIILAERTPFDKDKKKACRYDKIQSLLNQQEKYSIIDIKKMANNVYSYSAEAFIKKVIPALKGHTWNNIYEEEAFCMVSNWTAYMKTGSPEASFFKAFQMFFMENIFKDELGDTLYNLTLNHIDLTNPAFLNIIDQPTSSWYDNIYTPDKKESFRDISVTSFHKTVKWAIKEYGTSMNNWAWGRSHTLTFEHPLSVLPLMEKMLNIGPFPVNGDYETVHCMASDFKKPFRVIWGSTSRLIVDMHNMNNSISVLTTGQSGQVMDDHYRDQVQLYIANLYHPNLVDSTKIIQSGWHLLRLKPESAYE